MSNSISRPYDGIVWSAFVQSDGQIATAKAPAAMQKLDTDHNGSIDFTELSNGLDSLYATLPTAAMPSLAKIGAAFDVQTQADAASAATYGNNGLNGTMIGVAGGGACGVAVGIGTGIAVGSSIAASGTAIGGAIVCGAICGLIAALAAAFLLAMLISAIYNHFAVDVPRAEATKDDAQTVVTIQQEMPNAFAALNAPPAPGAMPPAPKQ